MLEMEIKIIDFKFLDGNRPLKAFVDLQIGDWIVREWRIIKENGWIQPMDWLL